MADYIILRNSVEQANWVAQPVPDPEDPDERTFYGHKFKVVMGGWKPNHNKSSTVQKTIGGKLDVSVGPIFFGVSYAIWLKEALYQEEDQDLGVLSDLETYFKLNNPNPSTGNPSNKIYLVDHKECDGLPKVGTAMLMLGDHSPEPATTIIVGEEAWYTVQIQLSALEAEA